MTNPIWPATASDWRATFERGLGLDPKAAAYRHAHGELEPDVFVAWIEVEYDESRGYHPDFVPALTRNIEGLLAWAYGRRARAVLARVGRRSGHGVAGA